MSGLGLGDTGEVERATVLFVQRATWTLGSRIAQQKHNPGGCACWPLLQMSEFPRMCSVCCAGRAVCLSRYKATYNVISLCLDLAWFDSAAQCY